MDTPPVTSLSMSRVPLNSSKLTNPATSWHAPFLELLRLLKISPLKSNQICDQHFCIQPSNDLSEISRVFLSVSTSLLRYDIDLKTIRVGSSGALPPAVTQLQEYANKLLRRNRVAISLVLPPSDSLIRLHQDLRDRLLQHDLMTDPAPFLLVDMCTCPACLHPLVNCIECCDKIACCNTACLISLVDCKQCPAHKRVVCDDCLGKNKMFPTLTCCPICQGWRCTEDVDWCVGLIVHPTQGSEKLIELSYICDWDNETIVRSHPPKPGPCKLCTGHVLAQEWVTCRNSPSDMAPNRCPSQTPFMTNHNLGAVHCPDCLELFPGYFCACQNAWLCDTCFKIRDKLVHPPVIITCPRCGTNYCTEAESSCERVIDFCWGCEGVIVCQDCLEEEELPEDRGEHSKRVVFTDQCGSCDVWTCGDCRSLAGTATCVHCTRWFCRVCVPEVINTCGRCGESICMNCAPGENHCDRAMNAENLYAVESRQLLKVSAYLAGS